MVTIDPQVMARSTYLAGKIFDAVVGNGRERS